MLATTQLGKLPVKKERRETQWIKENNNWVRQTTTNVAPTCRRRSVETIKAVRKSLASVEPPDAARESRQSRDSGPTVVVVPESGAGSKASRGAADANGASGNQADGKQAKDNWTPEQRDFLLHFAYRWLEKSVDLREKMLQLGFRLWHEWTIEDRRAAIEADRAHKAERCAAVLRNSRPSTRSVMDIEAVRLWLAIVSGFENVSEQKINTVAQDATFVQLAKAEPLFLQVRAMIVVILILCYLPKLIGAIQGGRPDGFYVLLRGRIALFAVGASDPGVKVRCKGAHGGGHFSTRNTPASRPLFGMTLFATRCSRATDKPRR